MNESYKKLAKVLRISPGDLINLDQQMSSITGQTGVIETIADENNTLVAKSLAELGLPKDSSAEEIYGALINKLIHIDKHLFDLLDRPDLTNMSSTCGKMCEVAFQVFAPPKGLFIKREKVVELLNKHKPDNLLEHFGYSSVD